MKSAHAGLAFLLLAPAALAAQVTTSVAPYTGIDQSLSTRPIIAGVSLGAAAGPIGIRVSGGVAHRGMQLSDSAAPIAGENIQAYAGDVDLILSTGRSAGASGTFGALEPRLFVGYGVRGEATAPDTFTQHRVVSVGTMLSYSLLSRLRFDLEARRMAPVEDIGRLIEGANEAWEYRVGLSLHFGKGNLRPRRGILSSIPGMGGVGGMSRAGSTSAGRTVATPAAGTLLASADQQVGTPYVWGASEPGRGFDCSGFVQYVFQKHGVRLPRTSREMAQVGQSVGRNMGALQPGDLMFFAQDGNGISHVAVYAGNNMMIHSSRSGNGVGYDDLTTSRGQWYQRIYVGGQRVLGVPTQGVTLAGEPAGGNRGPSRQLTNPMAGGLQGGLAAFAKAAGLRDLSPAAKRLYKPNETPDGPDGAPKRRW